MEAPGRGCAGWSRGTGKAAAGAAGGRAAGGRPLSCPSGSLPPSPPAPQITNVKLVLNDGRFTYEPSYNLLRKAPSLAVSRPLGRGKYKVRRGCQVPKGGEGTRGAWGGGAEPCGVAPPRPRQVQGAARLAGARNCGASRGRGGGAGQERARSAAALRGQPPPPTPSAPDPPNTLPSPKPKPPHPPTPQPQVGWNLKTDDITIEYNVEGVRLLAHKKPNAFPLLGVSFERDFSL
jgi:hypothetical protein